MSEPVDKLVRQLHAKRSGKGFLAKCPAHDDKNPSLSISEGADGRALLKCQAGCDTKDVIAALGLEPRDLFVIGGRNGSEPVATYDYTDATGRLLYQSCRFAPKAFRQRQPNERGGWLWSLKGVKRVLYRLPTVIAAQTVTIAEGEKDCDNLTKLGFTATCNPGGAGKWRDEYSETLRGKDIVIFGDDDEPGRAHVDQLIGSLTGKARSIKRVTLPEGLHDVSDYIASLPTGTAKESIAKLIEETPTLPDGLPEAMSLITLAEREPDPSKNLLGNRFLCRGGGMLHIGPSGIGKSSASVQQDIQWALGKPAFDIKPARPLRILCIQAENDDDDLAEMANGICARLNLTDKEREVARKNVIYVNERARTGEAFLETAARLLEKFGPFDVLRIDTLHAYLGADILDVGATARFLRNGLNPILQKFDCGNILNHHTPKPTNRDTSNWRTADWMYSGAGNADLTNWARAALVIETTHAPDVFKFHAAKRGSRIGWCDEQGQKVYERLFCWDRGEKIFWREATEEDAARVESSKPKAKGSRPEPGTEEDFLALVPAEGAINKYKLMENARAESMGAKRIGEKTARKYLADLLDERILFKWRIKRPLTNPEIRISRHEQTLI